MRALLPLLILAASLPAADESFTLYTSKVKPLLDGKCIECHGPKRAKHDLRLDTLEAMLKGGKELGPAVVPGKPEKSPLLELVLKAQGEDQAMPPRGPRLAKADTDAIRQWIATGAHTTADGKGEAAAAATASGTVTPPAAATGVPVPRPSNYPANLPWPPPAAVPPSDLRACRQRLEGPGGVLLTGPDPRLYRSNPLPRCPAMTHPPLILAVALCERILHDPQTRQASLINLMAAVHSPQVPVVLPVMGVLVSLTDGYGECQLVIEVRSNDESKPPLAKVEMQVRWGDPRHVLDIPCLINNAVFPAYGEYRVRVSCAGAMVERRLSVLPPAPPAAQPPPQPPRPA